ncbi:MAG TPA: 3-dehydro-L-gulonate 2-dehydrogenase [Chitinophagaceae bacterium]|nr:3-dehydro-L-gulonate 2-dehydrogenase [Chitinophagaceae bacterium]
MFSDKLFIAVPADAMLSEFNRVLLKHGFTESKALQCAEIFTANSIDGVYTHGVNRFARFVDYVNRGFVKYHAEPSLKNKFGGIEQWDGNLGPGPLNANFATDRAMQLAGESGIGCVALRNTNHWMRGGTYGWQAAKKGFVFIGFTNTIANMPAWGALDSRLGNNPLVIALPYHDEAIVLDMAMSQYSFGAMELAKMKNEKLGVDGGFDRHGNLTQDPAAILESRRPLAIGFWKGAGLSLLLDMLAALLSGGLATHQITSFETEYASQVFIAIDISRLGNHSSVSKVIEDILNDYQQSVPADDKKEIVYPGQHVLATRKHNLQNGIPVLKQVWQAILEL